MSDVLVLLFNMYCYLMHCLSQELQCRERQQSPRELYKQKSHWHVP